MDKHSFSDNFRLLITLISAWSCIGAGFYYFWNLGWVAVSLTAVLSLLTTFIFSKSFNWHIQKIIFSKSEEKNYATVAAFFVSAGFSLWLLFTNASTEAITSPWQVVSPWFFLFFALSIIFSFKLAQNNSTWRKFSTHLIYFIAFGVLAIVYKINYGFDPFIHQASEKFIAEVGPVLPKTFYYLGQYSLVVSWHKLFFLPIGLLDKWLLPLLASLFLPAAVESALIKAFGDKQTVNLLILALLILPFSFFTYTTPQGLGFLFALISVLFAFGSETKDDKAISVLTALAALACHPLAGLPALFFALTFIVKSSKFKYREPIYGLFLAANATVLPAIFYFTHLETNDWPTMLDKLINAISTLPNSLLPNQENIFLNLIYLLDYNKLIIYILLILGGLIFLIFKRKTAQIENYLICLSHSLAITLSFILMKTLDFSYLIDYEQNNYADRVLIIAGLVALPIAFITIYELIKKTQTMSSLWKKSLLLLLIILISANIYLSYPRKDNYLNSRGFAVSQSDIAAAKWINNDAQTKDYVVLSNQQLSAAALSQFGFAKYYPHNIFYYPLPTGSELYKTYLKMNEKPTVETAGEAQTLTGAKLVYFAVNKYWWDANRIIAEADLSASSRHDIGRDLVIFTYDFSKPAKDNKSFK